MSTYMIYVYVYIYMYMYIFIYITIYIYISQYIYKYIYIYIYLHTRTYVYIHTYIHRDSHSPHQHQSEGRYSHFLSLSHSLSLTHSTQSQYLSLLLIFHGLSLLNPHYPSLSCTPSNSHSNMNTRKSSHAHSLTYFLYPQTHQKYTSLSMYIHECIQKHSKRPSCPLALWHTQHAASQRARSRAVRACQTHETLC